MSGLLEVDHVCYAFGSAKPLLEDICFSLKKGELLVVAGRSGQGKSTLLELCAGVLEPQRGRLLWDGEEFGSIDARQLVRFRTSCGFMFQKHALISNLPLFENIALPLRYHGIGTDQQVEQRVGSMMQLCELSGFAAHLPENLSVGQLRCAALARALVNRPRLALLDDPVGGSDPFIEQTIISVLEYAVAHEGLCGLIASNSTRLLRTLPCRAVLLEAGRLIPFETIRDSGFSSLPPAVRELIEAYEQR